GHSRGGGVSVLATAGDPGIAALVTWASIGSTNRWTPEVIENWRARGKMDVVNARTGDVLPLSTDILDEVQGDQSGRLDIRAAAARIKAPWLIVHGDADEAVSVADGRQLQR